MENVSGVLQRLQEAGINLKPDKMTIRASEIKYLGHSLSTRGITVLPERVEAIKAYTRPTTLRKLRWFIGMTGHNGSFVSDFSMCEASLHSRGNHNIFPEAPSRGFEDMVWDGPEYTCAAMVETLPLVYSSIE